MDGEDADALTEKTSALSTAAMKLGEAIYKAEQEAGAAAAPEAEGPQDDNVVDAEFSDVEPDADDKK